MRKTVHPDSAGMVFAALFFCLSLTPSLLPRDWLNGGIVGGITAAIGYGLGVLIGAMARRLVARRPMAHVVVAAAAPIASRTQANRRCPVSRR